MHWLNLIVIAFLYALVGALIGVSYALLTGADMSSFGNVVAFAAVFGPVLVLVLAALRKLARSTVREAPLAHVIYRTLLITVAVPVLMHGAQLIAGALDVLKVARSFEVLKYWSAPLFFTIAVMYGIWRVIDGNRPARRV